MTKSKSASILLELNSDPEVIRYTHLQNSAAWKSRLTAEQYADREWHIGCQSKVGKRDVENHLGLFHFVLRDLELPQTDKVSNIVASCETMNRKGWRIAPNGELKEVVSPCIGGVYTIPEHRAKGYAALMITKLNEYWDSKLDKDSFMFLYSEVGGYYERFGYNSMEVPLHEVNIPDGYTPTFSEPAGSFNYLKYEAYQSLVDQQCDYIKNSLIAKSKTTDKFQFSLIPDINIFSWFHDRDLFISGKLHPKFKVEHFGVVASDGSNDHIIWLHDWNDKHLTVVSLAASSDERFVELFSHAVKEAQLFGLHDIVIWDSSLASSSNDYKNALDHIKSFTGSKTFQPNGSISAIRALDGKSPDSYSWEFNEKWCWF